MYIVGLTGGIGSGKTEAAKVFAELLVPIVDLDDIARMVTQKNSPGYDEINKFFGNKYLYKKQELVRRKIKIDIFKFPKIKTKIESLLHPIIFKECKKRISKYKKDKYIVVVIPLLFETENYLKLIDESLLIDCDEKIQFKRVLERDGLATDMIKSIIESQLSRDQKNKKADTIISNNYSKALLKDKVCQYHIDLKARIKG